MNSALRRAGVGVLHATRACRVDQSERSIDDTLLLEDRPQREAVLTKLSHGNVTTQRFVNQRKHCDATVDLKKCERRRIVKHSLGLCPTG